jgi:hypothetical protein
MQAYTSNKNSIASNEASLRTGHTVPYICIIRYTSTPRGVLEAALMLCLLWPLRQLGCASPQLH